MNTIKERSTKVLSAVKEFDSDGNVKVKRIIPRETKEALIAYLERTYNKNLNESTYSESKFLNLITPCKKHNGWQYEVTDDHVIYTVELLRTDNESI